MEFAIDIKSFADVLGRARKVCPKAVDFNLEAKKKGLVLSVTADDITASFKVRNVQIEDVGEPITLPLDPIMGVIKGRKLLTFTHNDGVLQFTDGGNYKGDIQIPEYTEIPLEKPTDGFAISLEEPEASAVFYQGVADTELSGSFSNAESMNVFLRLGKKGLVALCYDPYYMSRVIDSSAKFEIANAAIDLKIMDTIQSVVGKGDSYTLHMTESSVYAFNQDFMLRFPAIQVESVEENMKQMDSFIGTWLKEECSRVWVETAKLKEVLANVASFYQKGVPINFTVAKKGLVIGIKSSVGQIKESIEAKVENPSKDVFNCEYQLLSEVLDKVTVDTVPLSFIKDTLLYIHIDDGAREFFASVALQSK